MLLRSPLTALRGVGPKRAALLREAGCETVEQLLWNVPQGYEDRSSGSRVVDLEGPGPVTLVGRLRKVRTVRLRGRRSMVRAELLDSSGCLPVVWFNRPYLARQVDAQAEYLLHGQARTGRGGALELLNPSCERTDRLAEQGRWTSLYRSLAPGLGPALVRELVRRALLLVEESWKKRSGGNPAADPLPRSLLERYRLPTLHDSLIALHRPKDDADGEALNNRSTPYHERLIYGELLALQLRLAMRRREVRSIRGYRYRGNEVVTTIREALPFRLTAAQERVTAEILQDLHRPAPMRRLLQGDVGCGKTVVAVLAMAEALASGHQVALMAPTQLLAAQHHAVLCRWLGERWRIALLTGSTHSASALRERLRGAEIDLAVGTHALFQDSVDLPRLALVVIDEQHRFGVGQRQALLDKGARSDLLVMTATPIPRSLALTNYGDLDISLLDELPPGRRPVVTELVAASRRDEILSRLRAAAEAGEQGYVVYPLIEESDAVSAAAVEKEGRRVQQALGGVASAILHGRMAVDRRLEIVRAFAAGELRVLIATTVIEVGVDIPKASWMVIESAERFGLSQLHQLRGRVGRGGQEACCMALYGKSSLSQLGDEARHRLERFASTTDGFEIAEADLALRGPGDLAGTRQAGGAALKVADLVEDRQWLERATKDSRWLLDHAEKETLTLLMSPPSI